MNDNYRYIKSYCNPLLYNFRDKQENLFKHVLYNLNRTQSMFSWENLPESIPQRILEMYLQINGNCCFYEYENTLYVFTGGLGGEPDVYYMPTIYTIANPALNISKNLKINIDCVVMPNDSMYLGLMPLFTKYATQAVETELSLNIASINTRITSLISAPDDRTKVSAEKYLKDVEEGASGVIAENAFLDGIRVQPYAKTGETGVITDLIELLQYNKASLYNEIGLNANYNMKRESLNSSESQMNNDALLPLIDNMLESRQTAIKKVNEMFGTNIIVDFNSAWKDNMQEIEIAHEKISDKSENGDFENGETE